MKCQRHSSKPAKGGEMVDHIEGKFVGTGKHLEKETYEIYSKIFATIDPGLFLVKCHNFIPYILEDDHYFKFNAGRNRAFQDAGYKHKPAACGLGSPSKMLEISYVAGATQPEELENPRQISSFNYPMDKPKPLFSRAVRYNGMLYISGTASIVGSETYHKNDLIAQYSETVKNIGTLTGDISWQRFKFVIYLKNAEDEEIIRHKFPYDAEYVITDICYDDLLIEIEADQVS
jgi:chorismate lyase / 3-hydroxybenzoate synthase